MQFETEADVLAWFQKEPRVLSKEFLDAIPWDEVKNHPLDPAFVPVMRYLRDIEKSTPMYFDELRRTPTWNQPSIREFMERWTVEEPLHGDLLDRFMGEAGYPSEEGWFEKLQAGRPLSYHVSTGLAAGVAKVFGRRFTGVHMTIGAINELTTLSTYQQLWVKAKHPVLEKILRAIAREEARHYFFYWSVARVNLLRSDFSQKLNRAVTKQFWTPVGEKLKTPEESDLVIRTLFSGADGLRVIDQQVNGRMEQLPGLAGLKIVTERVARAIA